MYCFPLTILLVILRFGKMKKFVLLLGALSVSFLLSATDYQVMVLGDIHFDAEKYHVSPEGKIVTRYSEAYVDMWRGKSQELLKTSAKMVNENFPFVIQLGDFIQGYAVTPESLAQMLAESFSAVKKFFPNHKLLSVKGNHDIRRQITRSVDGKIVSTALWEHQIYEQVFLPLTSAELGRKSVKSNYAVSYNGDLYIFYDDFAEPQPQTSIDFLKKTLDAHPDVRNIFFITHIPLLPCSTFKPGWLLPSYLKVMQILAQRRNVIILAGNTHQPSFLQVKVGNNTVTQLVVSTLACYWKNGKDAEISAKGKKQFYEVLDKREKPTPNTPAAKKFLDSVGVEKLTIYSKESMQGFAVLKIRDNGSVDAEIYNNTSCRPAVVIKLR
jgi:hypothetical protein